MNNVGHNAAVIARVIQRASEMSEMVSPAFQIGIPPRAYDIGISNIFDADDPDGFAFTFQPRGDRNNAGPSEEPGMGG